MLERIAKLLNLLSVLILLLGALYFALAYQSYGISGCFAVAAVLLLLCYSLPGKKDAG